MTIHNIENTSTTVISSQVYIHASYDDQNLETMYKIGRGKKALYGLQYKLGENIVLFLR